MIGDFVDDVFVEFAVVAKGEKVELEGFAFHAQLVRNVFDINFGKIGLAGDRAKRSKFQAIEVNEVILGGMGVFESFQKVGFWLVEKIFGLGGAEVFEF